MSGPRSGESDRGTGRFQHGGLGCQLRSRDAGIGQDLAALLGVGAVEADHDRRPQLDAAQRLDDARWPPPRHG